MRKETLLLERGGSEGPAPGGEQAYSSGVRQHARAPKFGVTNGHWDQGSVHSAELCTSVFQKSLRIK